MIILVFFILFSILAVSMATTAILEKVGQTLPQLPWKQKKRDLIFLIPFINLHATL
jgi:hypothetical protein